MTDVANLKVSGKDSSQSCSNLLQEIGADSSIKENVCILYENSDVKVCSSQNNINGVSCNSKDGIYSQPDTEHVPTDESQDLNYANSLMKHGLETVLEIRNGEVNVGLGVSNEKIYVEEIIEPHCHNKTNKESAIIHVTANGESKENDVTPVASFFSLFQIKTNSIQANTGSVNEDAQNESNFLNERLSCCPFGTPNKNDEYFVTDKLDNLTEKFTVVDISPKSENSTVLPLTLPSRSHPDGGVVSSPEIISEPVSPLMFMSSQVLNSNSVLNNIEVTSIDNGKFTSPISSINLLAKISAPKLKLLKEGDISLCFLNHSKTVISKVLTSKFLRRWETHHIHLNDDDITSNTPNGILESPILYSNVEDVYIIGRLEQSNQLCIRMVITEGSIILQASNQLVRDQWLSSILWKKNMYKCRSILNNSTRPEIIIKEIKNMIKLTLDSPLQIDSIISEPVDVISKVLMEREICLDQEEREEVIVALVPLLEKTTPSPEMFHFFSKHCLLHPRSPIVMDVYTSLVHRILKRTYDFGKSPYMRKFVAGYMTALYSLNGGDKAIVNFVHSLHGPNYECPHPRVLQNLVAVNLSEIFSCFEEKRTESNNEDDYTLAMENLDVQLQCHITVIRAISEFGDWRPGLAQLLQPIPFPDDAVCCEVFIEAFTPVIKRIGTDPNCKVHEMVLGVREDKVGWLNIYCPSGLVCKDEGELWCQMLGTLISCCCRRKSFLNKLMKHLGALILVALRGHDVAQEILCLMLEWRIVQGENEELQIVTALESTEGGRERYSELCKRQDRLRQLQEKTGPRKLTLPSGSTDVDVAQLLSSGPFGNLECLSLAFTHVTSSCAHHLIQLPTLRCLNLWATHFGDAGLVIIAEHLDKLQVLNLCETPVTDKGISALTGMKSLRKLNLNSTKLSPETLERLKEKLPELQELDVRYTDAW